MKNNTYKNKPKSIDTMDYDKSKYKSWLQQICTIAGSGNPFEK